MLDSVFRLKHVRYGFTESPLFGIGATDPLSPGAAALLLALVAGAASIFPPAVPARWRRAEPSCYRDAGIHSFVRR